MLIKLLLAMLTAWSVQMAEGGQLPLAGGQLHGSGELPAGEVETAKESGTPKEPPAEGLWPSQNLVRLFVVRICKDVSNKYGLDDDQSRRYQEAEVKRWSDFTTTHRAQIQPVINEFIEMRMELEPPAKERVQAWAQRATPVFDTFRTKVTQATDEFREVLTPLQEAKFESDFLQMGVGLQVAENKLKQWRNGEFEPEEFWEPTRAERRKRREERRKERAGEAGETPEVKAAEVELDQISQEVVAWEKYVEEFIRIYKLDEGQRDAARSCFTELKGRALAHRDTRREEIARLEQRIAQHTGSKEDLAAIKAQLVEMYGPIDEMFQELRRRLEQIPTATQKATAGKIERGRE